MYIFNVFSSEGGGPSGPPTGPGPCGIFPPTPPPSHAIGRMTNITSQLFPEMVQHKKALAYISKYGFD
jgi:hypothetical protein